MYLVLASAALLMAGPPAAPTEDGAASQLATITVTGRSRGYIALDSVTATRTDTLLINVPQTITVVTRAQLDDQAQQGLGDVLRYVPGTTVGQGEGNRDQITLRGQNTTADFFLDGVRDDSQYFRGLYNLERVEVLKGPYALIFGRGGGGGIVNRVQKTPVFGSASASGRAGANSLGAWNLSADINAPLGEGAAFRFNAIVETLDNHRDYFEGERFAVNPYLAVDLGAGWQAGLSYEYVNDDRVTDRGIPALAGVPIAGYRDRFFGVPGVNRTTLEASIVKLRLDGALADNVQVSATVLHGDYEKLYSNVFPSGAATGRSPYQLASTTVASTPARRSAVARPASLPLAWTTRSRSPRAAWGRTWATPSAAATVARPGSTSTSSTSAPGIRAASHATRRPTAPPPTTAMRAPTAGAPSQRTFTAVSALAASAARPVGTSSGSGTTAVAGTTKRVWCGCRQKTRRPTRSGGPDATRPTMQ